MLDWGRSCILNARVKFDAMKHLTGVTITSRVDITREWLETDSPASSDPLQTHLHFNQITRWLLYTLKFSSLVLGEHPCKAVSSLREHLLPSGCLKCWVLFIFCDGCLRKAAFDLRENAQDSIWSSRVCWYFSKRKLLSAEIYCLFEEENGRLSEHTDQ